MPKYQYQQGWPQPLWGPMQSLIRRPPTFADTTDYCLLVIHTPIVNYLTCFISFYTNTLIKLADNT